MGKGLSDTEPFLWDSNAPLSASNFFPGIVNILVIIGLVVSLALFYQRRHLFPLKGRGTNAIFVASVLYLGALVNSAARGPGWPCVLQLVLLSVCSHCACAVYVYRILVLLVKHDIAQEINLGGQTAIRRRSCLHHPKFIPFLKFRRWVFPLVLYGFIITIVFLGAALIQGDDYYCDGSLPTYSNISLVVIMLPIMAFLSWKLRNFPVDGRKISTEFRVLASCIIVALITEICLSTFLPPIYYTGVYLLAAVGVALSATSLLYPVYLSYGPYTLIPESSTSGMLTRRSLEELLQCEDFREAFLVHLKGEFSAECLVFWQAVTTFKAKGERSAPEMIADMQVIFELYLLPSAPYLINTSLDSVHAAQQSFKQAQESGSGLLNVFDTLLGDVVALMKSDPLPRFLRTPLGRELVLRNDSSRTDSSHTATSSPTPTPCSTPQYGNSSHKRTYSYGIPL